MFVTALTLRLFSDCFVLFIALWRAFNFGVLRFFVSSVKSKPAVPGGRAAVRTTAKWLKALWQHVTQSLSELPQVGFRH
jgi:hypothetical protein